MKDRNTTANKSYKTYTPKAPAVNKRLTTNSPPAIQLRNSLL